MCLRQVQRIPARLSMLPSRRHHLRSRWLQGQGGTIEAVPQRISTKVHAADSLLWRIRFKGFSPPPFAVYQAQRIPSNASSIACRVQIHRKIGRGMVLLPRAQCTPSVRVSMTSSPVAYPTDTRRWSLGRRAPAYAVRMHQTSRCMPVSHPGVLLRIPSNNLLGPAEPSQAEPGRVQLSRAESS